jgi:DHA2 family multidrug resistance protein
MGVGLYGLTYLYPLYLGRVRGYDSLMIGETLAISGIAMFLTAPISGALSNKLDPRFMMMIGFVGFGAGTWIMTGLTSDWDFWEILIPQILRGSSLMLAMVPINNLALGTLPPDRIKNASGLFNLTRNLGGAVGLAVINTVLSHSADRHYANLADHVRWGSWQAETTLSNMAKKLSSHGLDGTKAALSQFVGMVKQQAAVLSFIDVFQLLTLLFFSLAIFTLLMRKPPASAGGGAPGGH